jgi:hypothetical protein
LGTPQIYGISKSGQELLADLKEEKGEKRDGPGFWTLPDLAQRHGGPAGDGDLNGGDDVEAVLPRGTRWLAHASVGSNPMVHAPLSLMPRRPLETLGNGEAQHAHPGAQMTAGMGALDTAEKELPRECAAAGTTTLFRLLTSVTELLFAMAM